MTVSELISLLSALPGDLPVILWEHDIVGMKEADGVSVEGIGRGKPGTWEEGSIYLRGKSEEKAVLIS